MSDIASDIKFPCERLSGITLSGIARLMPDDLYPKKTRHKSGHKLYPVIRKYVCTLVGHNSLPGADPGFSKRRGTKLGTPKWRGLTTKKKTRPEKFILLTSRRADKREGGGGEAKQIFTRKKS